MLNLFWLEPADAWELLICLENVAVDFVLKFGTASKFGTRTPAAFADKQMLLTDSVG
jgi:hypothetical protein